jgi:hypothetical protein
MMKKAITWTESVCYIECPECEETEELGSGVIWGEKDNWVCGKCKLEFEVDDQTDRDSRW